MLEKLIVQNYALIDSVQIDFRAGLNILTGETGAGKSILLDAIGLLLGERARTDVIRQGADAAFVEGWFNVPPELLQDVLESRGETDAKGLLLRREVHASGRSRCFANDSPITLQQLSALGDRLVDLHGQHEHQALLKTDRHLGILDSYGVGRHLRTRVRESFRRARQLEDTFDALTSKEERLREQRELLEFQIGEIAKADPKEGEEEALEREEKIQRHCEKIFQVSERVHDLLYSGEGSVEEKATSAQALLQDLSSVDAVFGDWARSCEEAKILLGEMLRALSAYTGKIEFQPQRLEEIRERLALLGRLKKKYGGSLDRMIEFRKNAEASVREADSCADEITRTREALERERAALAASCAELSASRRSAADALERSIGAALSELGLSGGSFRVDLRRRPVTDGGVDLEGQRFAVSATGIDLAEFYIALNPGEPMKPLAQVASGGEVSRIMLALKSVLATADSVPVLIFDEIDTGISGRIAHVVGRKLKALGQIHQVVCITHLPQIASLADRHYSVEKTVSAGRTYTSVRPLENEDRIREIAKLIGGETVTESALSSARELVRAQ